MNFSGDQINALQSLLEQNGHTPDDDKNQHQPMIPTNKTIVKDRNKIIESVFNVTPSSVSSSSSSRANQKDIWLLDEVPTEDELLAISNDQRIAPKYTFYFRNNVGTEDMFLGMSDATPASQHATHLVSYHLCIFDIALLPEHCFRNVTHAYMQIISL